MYPATNMRLDVRSDSKENRQALHLPPFLFYQFFGFIYRSGRVDQYQHIMPSALGDFEQRPYLNSKHALAKIVGLVLGINCLFVTYYIHNDSPWHSKGMWLNCSMVEKLKGGNELEWIAYGLHFRMTVDHCPSITMERFLLGTNFLILIISAICFVCCCWANLDTVNAIRGRESFYNATSGVIILIGAVLMAVSTGQISRNKCETKSFNETMFVKSDLCDKYFLDSNKYVAVILGLIEGGYLITLACLIDNMKLYGLKAGVRPRRDLASTDADIEINDTGPVSGRKSVIRSVGKRRSSLAKFNKKGIGSFGAVTNNMTSNTSSKLGKSSSNPIPRTASRKVANRKENEKETETTT